MAWYRVFQAIHPYRVLISYWIDPHSSLMLSSDFIHNYTQIHSPIKFNCIVDWLKFSHSHWLERLINIFFSFFFLHSFHLFYLTSPSSSSPSIHNMKTWTLKQNKNFCHSITKKIFLRPFFFFLPKKKTFRFSRSLSRNYKSSHLSDSAPNYFRGGRPSSNKSSYSPSSNMEFLRGVYAFMQVSRSSVSVAISIY